jgi:hypothetical protein
MAKRKRSVFDLSEMQLRANLAMYHARDWARAVKRYEANPRDFYTAFWFLNLHPANQRQLGQRPTLVFYSGLMENLYLMVVKVDPKTKRIEGKKHDKKTNVWVEWGPWIEEGEKGFDTPAGGMSSHDPRVDTGGKSFERAIINLAHNIYVLYGDQRETKSDKWLKKKDRW